MLTTKFFKTYLQEVAEALIDIDSLDDNLIQFKKIKHKKPNYSFIPRDECIFLSLLVDGRFNQLIKDRIEELDGKFHSEDIPFFRNSILNECDITHFLEEMLSSELCTEEEYNEIMVQAINQDVNCLENWMILQQNFKK